MVREASLDEMTPEEAVASLVKVAAAAREKRADGFMDQLKNYGQKGIAGLKDYGQQGLSNLQGGLTSDNAATRGLYGAGLGAAAGGLGGAVMGATGQRKKSPWTTALSGAIAGGALGGGAAAGLPMLRDAMNTPKPPPGLHAEAARDFAGEGMFSQLAKKVTGAPEANNVAYSKIIGRGINRFATGAAAPGAPGGAAAPPVPASTDAFDNFIQSPGAVGAGATAGVGAAAGVDKFKTMGEDARAFQAGATDLIGKKAPDALDPAIAARLKQVRDATAGKTRFGAASGYAANMRGSAGDRAALGRGGFRSPWNGSVTPFAGGDVMRTAPPIPSGATRLPGEGAFPIAKADQQAKLRELFGGDSAMRRAMASGHAANGTGGVGGRLRRYGIGALGGAALPFVGNVARNAWDPSIAIPED